MNNETNNCPKHCEPCACHDIIIILGEKEHRCGLTKELCPKNEMDCQGHLLEEPNGIY